jgi:hypothetical protein
MCFVAGCICHPWLAPFGWYYICSSGCAVALAGAQGRLCGDCAVRNYSGGRVGGFSKAWEAVQ